MEGNQMKMREALIIAKKAICHHAEHICQSLSWENSDLQSNCADVLCAHRELCKAKTAINAALSAPPRQCDVGTAEEQGERCLEQFNEWRRKSDGKKLITAIMAWAQTPYAEKGDGDGE